MKFYSFDIFDTCITRSCGSSDNIFYLLALDFILDGNKSKIMGFIKERKRAECDAGRILNKECPTIDDIYSIFDTSLFTDVDKNVIKKRELEIELGSFSPVKRTIELLQKARTKGKVVFISDMYFSQSQLYDTLVKLGIIKNDEHLYVSCDVGVSKNSGAIFDYVRDIEKVNVKKWIHYGDDYHNDYLMPRSKGINAVKIETLPSSIESEWENEARLMNNKSLSVMAGVFRSVRLSSYSSKEDEFVPDIMASSFVPFVSSILNNANKLGIKKLFFAARDTRIMYLLAKQQAHLFKDIEIKYLHISTRVLYPLIIKDATPDEIKKIIHFVPGITGISVLNLFNYQESEIEEIGRNIDLYRELYDERCIDALVGEMLRGSFKQSLMQRCNEKRELVKGYLIQEGLLSQNDEKIGLVDIGWSGTSQTMINLLFPNNVVFYYWGTSSTIKYANTGDFISFCYGEQLNEIDRIMRIVESYMCRSIEGSTINYRKTEGIFEPIFGNSNKDLKYQESVSFNESIVLQVGARFSQYFRILDSSEMFHKTCALRALQNFTKLPTYKLVKTIAPDLMFSHYSLKRPIIQKIYPFDLVKMYLMNRNQGFASKLKKYEMLWMPASIVYTYGVFAEWMMRNHIMYRLKMILKTILLKK